MVSPPCSTPCGKEIMIGNRSNQDPFRKELEKPFHVSQAHITACGDDVKQHPGGIFTTSVKTHRSRADPSQSKGDGFHELLDPFLLCQETWTAAWEQTERELS